MSTNQRFHPYANAANTNRAERMNVGTNLGNPTSTGQNTASVTAFTISAGPEASVGIPDINMTRRSQIVRLRLPSAVLSPFPHGTSTLISTNTAEYVPIGTELHINTVVPFHQTVVVRVTHPFTTQQKISSEISHSHRLFVHKIADDHNLLSNMIHDNHRAGRALNDERANVEARATQLTERERALDEKESALNKRAEELEFSWEEVEAIIKEANEKGISLRSAEIQQRMLRSQEEE